jgi:hypothetical protein
MKRTSIYSLQCICCGGSGLASWRTRGRPGLVKEKGRREKEREKK